MTGSDHTPEAFTPEVFVAVLDVDRRERADQERLRAQATAWFGTPAVRCLDLEVREHHESGRPLRYRVRGRFVRGPSQPQGRVEKLGEWLGLIRAQG